MKITKAQLKQIIKEEIQHLIAENEAPHPYITKFNELRKQMEKAGYDAGTSLRSSSEDSVKVVDVANNMPSTKELDKFTTDFYSKHRRPKRRDGSVDSEKERALGGVNQWLNNQVANLERSYLVALIKGAEEAGFSFKKATSGYKKGQIEGEVNNLFHGTLTKAE
jgi:hypothetical protein